jgi:hypothetical protein
MSDTLLDEAKSLETVPERLSELALVSIGLARVVAGNPNTSPKLLKELSRSDDFETRQNTTGNPNTATDILFKLGREFPEEFLNNPVFGLLLLENPNFISTIPDETLIELLKVKNVPQIMIDWAITAPIRSPSINYRLAVASNLNTTKDVLLKLYELYPQTNVAQAALLHVNWKGEMTSHWHEAAFTEIRTCGYIERNEVKEKLLQELNIIPRHLLPYSKKYRYVISLYPKYKIIHKIMNNLNKIFIINLFFYKLINTILYLNQQPETSLETLISTPIIILGIPLNATIFTINYCKNNKIKSLILLSCLVLSIITLPTLIIAIVKVILFGAYFILIILFAGLLGWVIGAVAGSIGVLLIYAIIYFVIYPIKQIFTLVKKDKQKTNKPKKLSRYSRNLFEQDLKAAQSANTPITKLFELTSSRWLYVREAVAANPNTNTEALKKLVKDAPPTLQALIAKHPNTPVEVLAEFAQSKSINKMMLAAQNVRTPLPNLKYLTRSSKKYGLAAPEAIKTIAKCYPEELANVLVEYIEKTPFPSAARLFLLLHQMAPSYFLARHYRSLDWRERYAVAQNPNTPLNILEKLILDANCIVRATAKAKFYKSE